MKFHWGWGIASVYILFVAAFLVVLFYSFGQDNSLVVDDYYQQDIHYQEHIDRRTNYERLTGQVTHVYDADAALLTLIFPEGMDDIQGECHFYRPSSARQDYRVPLRPDTTHVRVIPVRRLIPGRWRVKLEWASGGKSYYHEEPLLITASSPSPGQ